MIGIGIGLMLIVFLVAKAERRRRTNGAWSAAAKQLGLEVSLAFDFRMSGHGLTIAGTPGHGMTYEFGGLPWDLSFGSPEWFARNGESLRRVSVGDELFDLRVHVRGAEEDVVPLLDRATRIALIEFVESGGRAEWGKLKFSPSRLERDPETLVEAARSMLALGERLTQPGRRKLLLANATGDPVAGVRARNLEVLAARFRDSEEAHAAAQPGLDDPSAAVRFVAADVERGEKSMAVLRGIVVDARVEPQLRAEAFARLVDFYGYAKARDLVPAALEQPIRLLRRAAAVAAGDAHDLEQVERLCRSLREEPAWLIEAVVTALEKLGDARAEPALIALLGHSDDAARTTVARALGVLGTVKAVEPLLPLTKGLLQTGLHAAACDAVRRIQERLGDADAGRLSMAQAEGPSGALSIASEGGELSVADRVKE